MNAKADQAEPYTLWGVACSLYTGPVRSYLIKKELGYRECNPSAPEFAARIVPTVKSVVVPVLETPEGEILQDSVEIIQRLETRVAEPALNPPTPVQRVVARLLEAFGAEYMLRLAMHYRWSYRAEQEDFLCAEFGRGTIPVPTASFSARPASSAWNISAVSCPASASPPRAFLPWNPPMPSCSTRWTHIFRPFPISWAGGPRRPISA